MTSESGVRAGNRRLEVIEAAARLFRQRGVAQVGIDEIGAAAGMTGPAIYRYFSGKQELLAAVALELLDQVRREYALQPDSSSTEESGPYVASSAMLRAAIRVALRNPDGLLVYLRHLPEIEVDQLSGLRNTRDSLGPGWNWFLLPIAPGDAATAHPGPDKQDPVEQVRLRCLTGMLSHLALVRSPSQVRRTELARAIAAALLAAPLPQSLPIVDGRRPMPVGLAHVTRREAILAAATQLVSERGFASVSLADIGAEVGVTASAVMRHFESKEHLLAAANNRAGEQIAGGIAIALRESYDADEAVRRIVAVYADFANHCRDLVVIHTTVAPSLSLTYREERKRRQRMYVDELANAISHAYAAMSPEESRMRAGAVFATVNEAAMSHPRVLAQCDPSTIQVLALAVASGG